MESLGLALEIPTEEDMDPDRSKDATSALKIASDTPGPPLAGLPVGFFNLIAGRSIR